MNKREDSMENNAFKSGKKKAAEIIIANVNTFNTENLNNVTVTGVLLNSETGQPASGVSIPLVNERGDLIKTTTTNEKGEFRYVNIPANETFRILAGNQKSKLTDRNKYIVQNIVIKGYERDVASIEFDNIYFDFNKSALKDQSKSVLNDLVSFYKNHPEIQIEINAFTDNVGSSEYNVSLSEKRGQTAFDFLSANGVDRTALVIKARGKELPFSKNQELNRRVEFYIKGAMSDGNVPVATYIIEPNTTLFKIATQFGITVTELKEMNGLKSDIIQSGTAIKIKKTDLKPLNSILAERDESPIDSKKNTEYLVKEGDTLFSISRRAKRPLQVLMTLNGMSDSKIKAGQLIKLK